MNSTQSSLDHGTLVLAASRKPSFSAAIEPSRTVAHDSGDRALCPAHPQTHPRGGTRCPPSPTAALGTLRCVPSPPPPPPAETRCPGPRTPARQRRGAGGPPPRARAPPSRQSKPNSPCAAQLPRRPGGAGTPQGRRRHRSSTARRSCRPGSRVARPMPRPRPSRSRGPPPPRTAAVQTIAGVSPAIGPRSCVNPPAYAHLLHVRPAAALREVLANRGAHRTLAGHLRRGGESRMLRTVRRLRLWVRKCNRHQMDLKAPVARWRSTLAFSPTLLHPRPARAPATPTYCSPTSTTVKWS